MENNLTKKLVLCALFMAMICVVTMFVKSPLSIGGAYINAGDAVIYAAGAVMAAPWAAAAAGIGSFLADVLVGSSYFLSTLVIKSIMGLVVGLALFNRRQSLVRDLVFMGIASLVMAAGYAIYEYLFLGYATMIADLVPDLIQAAGGVVIGLLLARLVRRIVPDPWKDAFRR